MRRRRVATWGALVAVMAGVVACTGPRTVSLEELVREQERHEGRAVVTTGTVVEFDEDDGALERHVVVEDERANRVRLVPLERAEPYVGQRVRVQGRFTFDEGVGRTLEIEAIVPLRQQGG